jgi:flagellum-specific ATP synthase
LIDLGAYLPGKNPKLDTAIRLQPELNAFLRQLTSENSPLATTREQLLSIAGRL